MPDPALPYRKISGAGQIERLRTLVRHHGCGTLLTDSTCMVASSEAPTLKTPGCRWGHLLTFCRPGWTALSLRETNFSTALSACSSLSFTRSEASSSSIDCLCVPDLYRALRASRAAWAACKLHKSQHAHDRRHVDRPGPGKTHCAITSTVRPLQDYCCIFTQCQTQARELINSCCIAISLSVLLVAHALMAGAASRGCSPREGQLSDFSPGPFRKLRSNLPRVPGHPGLRLNGALPLECKLAKVGVYSQQRPDTPLRQRTPASRHHSEANRNVFSSRESGSHLQRAALPTLQIIVQDTALRITSFMWLTMSTLLLQCYDTRVKLIRAPDGEDGWHQGGLLGFGSASL